MRRLATNNVGHQTSINTIEGILLDNVSFSFDQDLILNSLSATISKGDRILLTGKSGDGKSTLLNIIAGLETINEGNVYIDDYNVSKVEPKDRNIAMVFQSYALYPHMSIAENLSFGLRMAKGEERLSDEEIVKRVQETAKLMELEDQLDKKPKQLSGGQRQRVALGRALIRQPKVLLMDEPLSNLDAELRHQMRAEIRRLHETLGTTTVYVCLLYTSPSPRD